MGARSGVAGAYAPGDYVKVEFRDEVSGESEWMWVRVESADDSRRVVFGRLDNEPVVLAGEMHLNQGLAISYDSVRGHVGGKGFAARP